MKNQYSFRLTTTLLPTDTQAKTTQVINKTDSNGNRFYPTFSEETVVITNDDRTIIETTRATCSNGVITFVKRGLSDDRDETQISNRKLTRNPGSLCFITAGAGDRIDKDEDMEWKGNQTYKGRLITEKGVEYPHFDSLEDLQDYESPFGGMFAVVDSDGELYRYNAETEEWSVVTTSTPAQPAKASKVAIGTVRVATDTEFENDTEQGEHDEYLVASIPQVKSMKPSLNLHVVNVNLSTNDVQSKGATASVSYTVPRDGFLELRWTEYYTNGKELNDVYFSSGGEDGEYAYIRSYFADNPSGVSAPSGTIIMSRRELVAVKAGQFTLTATVYDDSNKASMPQPFSAKINKFFYFE